jgi:hypothetical protein
MGETGSEGRPKRFLAPQTPATGETKVPGTTQAEPPNEGWLRERAEAYRKAGDHLSAAICFALADEEDEAGHSYRAGARGMKEEQDAGE